MVIEVSLHRHKVVMRFLDKTLHMINILVSGGDATCITGKKGSHGTCSGFMSMIFPIEECQENTLFALDTSRMVHAFDVNIIHQVWLI